MKIPKAREIAAQLLCVGKTRIYIDPTQLGRVKEAMTKEDIRALIKERVIKKRKDAEQSRARARKLREKKKKGRKKGEGKRKGKYSARNNPKENWMRNVRAQRKLLKKLKEENPELFKKVSYRDIYRKIKGGFFRGKKHLESYIKGVA
ncbi:MAG: 50S ribosomal protein L19e [Candidatus Iainarchaeum archaeon]|uniref:Large ribosomal subunit protein eL19 n=1 Tax=Candidatus Iainarchaeum sp. TaxID=3101447 RepID=A0A497JGD5_9ARCH|nr:MAG: 50S ribosomal protein L19e [Candidatus Diapherotrites archaeon]